MRLGIRARLFLTYLALVVLVLGLSGFFLAGRLDGALRQQIAGELLAHARTMRQIIEDTALPASGDAVRWLARAAGVRLTVVSVDGTVTADSELSGEQLSRLDNHANRPEVVQARKNGEGSQVRYSTTLQEDMLYVAVACERPETCAAVRVARPLGVVRQEMNLLLAQLAVALAVGVGLALLLGWLAASVASSPMRRLVAETRVVLDRRQGVAPGPGQPEDLGDLGLSFRRLAEEMERLVLELGRRRDLFLAVLESMQEGVLVIDERMKVTHANRAAGVMLGTGAVMAERALVDLVRVPELHRLVQRALDGQEGGQEFDLTGSDRKLQARAAPLRNSPGAVLVLRDVTELRRLETVRRDFVANVAHELRTPFSVVRASIETLLSGALDQPGRAREFTEAAMRSVERLSRLVEDLLDLSRLESGDFRPRLGPVAPAQVGRRVLDALRPPAEKKRILLAMQVPEEMAVLSWPEGLEQVLFNLVDNAVKYIPEGGRIELRAEKRPAGVRLEVRDDGPGIEPHHRPRLFERFYRVDKGRSRELGGTGLGLAIVKHLVESMGGRVGVEAGPTSGSVFWVELPSSQEAKDGTA